MNDENHTQKCAAFLDALRALCVAHGVTLSPSGYDGLQVWDADATTDPLHFNGIEDRTRPNDPPNPVEPQRRADGMPASADERRLRRMLALRVAMPHMYMDDGEMQGQEHGISIDFMREDVADIEAKLLSLNLSRLGWIEGQNT